MPFEESDLGIVHLQKVEKATCRIALPLRENLQGMGEHMGQNMITGHREGLL